MLRARMLRVNFQLFDDWLKQLASEIGCIARNFFIYLFLFYFMESVVKPAWKYRELWMLVVCIDLLLKVKMTGWGVVVF